MALPTMVLHELFEAQARHTPRAPAVVADDATLSYAELDRQANRMAHHLRRQGIGSEARVGVSMRRSAPLVTALLGILKAGAAYVPLDPRYPSDRRDFMLGDAGVRTLVVDDSATPDRVPPGIDLLECTPEMARNCPSTKPKVPVHPDNLSYVMYTSGSTGRPKGVMVPHRAICNHTLWIQETFQLRPSDRLLHKTPIGFDPSLTEFMAPLVAGAQLVLAADHAHQDPAYLVQTMIDHEITVLQVVPTLLRVLLDQRQLSRCRSLRMLFSGGEALPTELVRRLRAVLPVEIHNFYGPTEATVDAACLPAVEADRGATVPIGYPIPNTTIHILDADLRPVPEGTLGELYIGGLPVARGYLDRPDLTARCFVPDPFASAREVGRRMYRTGDLGRCASDGVIEFAGRTDQQLKVHGVRIEPSEIEAALCEHGAVRDAAVIAQDTPGGGQRLVAYVAVGASANGSQDHRRELSHRLRDQLSAKLPSYFVPSSITVLGALPRTANGKLDRGSLPAARLDAPTSTEFVSPRSPLERELADAFAELLGVARIGIHDQLFDLGADSLVVAQLGTHVTNTYTVNLPLFLLFTVPTVAGVAELVQTYTEHGEERLVTRSTSLVTAEAELDPNLIPDWGA